MLLKKCRKKNKIIPIPLSIKKTKLFSSLCIPQNTEQWRFLYWVVGLSKSSPACHPCLPFPLLLLHCLPLPEWSALTSPLQLLLSTRSRKLNQPMFLWHQEKGIIRLPTKRVNLLFLKCSSHLIWVQLLQGSCFTHFHLFISLMCLFRVWIFWDCFLMFTHLEHNRWVTHELLNWNLKWGFFSLYFFVWNFLECCLIFMHLKHLCWMNIGFWSWNFYWVL